MSGGGALAAARWRLCVSALPMVLSSYEVIENNDMFDKRIHHLFQLAMVAERGQIIFEVLFLLWLSSVHQFRV